MVSKRQKESTGKIGAEADHDLDDLDLNLLFRDIVQDLYSTDAIQETCPGSCRLYGSHAAT